MSSWEQKTSPPCKFEHSPAESFLSVSESYPSLFEPSTPRRDSTMDPLDMMTPQSFTEDPSDTAVLSALASSLGSAGETSAPANGEKKATKKRKSWGQVLPEPKTNLPPRKRAKTEDEKEQRRVERVLRNRRAAQSSRERKRQEVEALEQRNQELEAKLQKVEELSLRLAEELNRIRQNPASTSQSSAPLGALRSNPVTFSQELFSSQDGHQSFLGEEAALLGISIPEPSNATVDPSSLSPELGPVPDQDADEEAIEASETLAAPTTSTSTDLTQRPAVSSVGGATSVLDVLATQSVADHVASAPERDAHLLGDGLRMSTPFDTDSYVLESGLLSSPNSVDYEYDNLVGDAAAFATTEFDISQFLHDDVNGGAMPDSAAGNGFAYAAEHELGLPLPDFEIQISSENLNLQPHPGASSSGCDDGGIAVGV